MRNKLLRLVLAAILLLACIATPQNRRDLRRTEVIPVPGTRGRPILGSGPLKCGQDESSYFRFVNQENFWMNPTASTEFSLTSVAGLEKANIWDVSPGGSGDLYLLAFDRSGSSEEFYVVTLDSSASLVSKTKLPSGITPYQLAVFSSGEWLISGQEQAHGTATATAATLTGIFDVHGQLITKLELPGDIELKKQTEPGAVSGAVDPKEYRRALNLSIAEASKDGKIYLTRYGTTAPVFAISRGGEVEPIRIEIPSGTYLSSVKVDDNRIATMFIRKKDPNQAPIAEVIISVWSASQEKPEKIEEFSGSEELGISWSCYQSGVFTFVRTGDDGRLQLARASSRNGQPTGVVARTRTLISRGKSGTAYRAGREYSRHQR